MFNHAQEESIKDSGKRNEGKQYNLDNAKDVTKHVNWSVLLYVWLYQSIENLWLQGHRAELYAARVAKCLTALEGREKVIVEDLKKAVSICLQHPI